MSREPCANPQAREITQRARLAFREHGLSVSGNLAAYRAAPRVGQGYFWPKALIEAGAPPLLAFNLTEDLARASRCAARAAWRTAA